MSRARDFIALASVIAAGDSPEQDKKTAIGKVFARYLDDASNSVLGEQDAHAGVRRRVLDLHKELEQEVARPHPAAFGVVLQYALDLVADWLRLN